MRRNRAWDIKVGELVCMEGVYEVSGIGCFERIMGLRDVGVRGGTPVALGKRSTVDK